MDCNYAEVRVHENLNLENPDEVAWVSNATGSKNGALCVFYTQLEAKQFLENWGRAMVLLGNLSSDGVMPTNPADCSVPA